jgi:hypothetical protein
MLIQMPFLEQCRDFIPWVALPGWDSRDSFNHRKTSLFACLAKTLSQPPYRFILADHAGFIVVLV